MLKRYSWRALSLALVLASVLPAQEPLNLSTARRAVVHYVDSGSYDRDIAIVAEEASKWIEERVARKLPGEKLMLVLDIDETVISNMAYMRTTDFGYLPNLWKDWVAAGKAAAIKPMLVPLATARRLGVNVVYLTGRKDSDRSSTEMNLRTAGFGDYQQLILMPSLHTGTTGQYKTAVRQRLESEGWTIIANMGDQASDLEGGASERGFKLPNPFYLTK